ncbi:hypothetical protein [Streptomyces marincola]|nr:hypothetical protein [Streptomyces marincola]
MTVNPHSPVTPDVGTMAHDAVRDRIGRVVAHFHGAVWLRPPGGGTEWAARPEDLTPLPVSASLRARVAELNRRARHGR